MASSDESVEFAVGEIVELVSGGPKMTVQSWDTRNVGSNLMFKCQWFAGKKLESGSFRAEQLRKSANDS